MSEALTFELVPIEALPADVGCLVYDILYKNWNVAREAPWFDAQDGGCFLTARATADSDSALTGTLLGVSRLMPPDPADPHHRQIRQVAVAADQRGSGLGRKLMHRIEAQAREEGATTTWLNARQPAWGFYERLDYRYTGDIWYSKLTVIPHRRMEKALR